MIKELTDTQKATMSINAGFSLLKRFSKVLEIQSLNCEYKKITKLMAQLLAVESYVQSGLFDSDTTKRLMYVSDELKKMRLDVVYGMDGNIKTNVSKKPVATNVLYHMREVPDSSVEDIDYFSLDGNTYYHIQNLNIYLTADVVQQLNINPQQVINMIKDQLKTEIDKQEKK